MVGTPHGDQLRASGIAFGQLERPFDRFGARIDEIETRQPARKQRRHLCGILHLRRFDQLAVDHDVHVTRGLFLYGLHDGRIAVPDVAHRYSGDQVVIAFSFGRIEERPFGARHLDQHRGRRGLADMGQELFSEDGIHGRFPNLRARIPLASFTLDIIQR